MWDCMLFNDTVTFTKLSMRSYSSSAAPSFPGTVSAQTLVDPLWRGINRAAHEAGKQESAEGDGDSDGNSKQEVLLGAARGTLGSLSSVLAFRLPRGLRHLHPPHYLSPSPVHIQCVIINEAGKRKSTTTALVFRGARAEHGVFWPSFVTEGKVRTAGLLHDKWYQPVSPSVSAFINMSVCKEENKQKAHQSLPKQRRLHHYFIPESSR